jgi:hypothetical protein
MATPKAQLTLQHLEQLADSYVDDCMTYTKDHPTASGRTVKILDRQIPTIDYFLRIWIPRRGEPTICRSTYYRWLNDDSHTAKQDTIRSVEGLFKALATDIVANECKGIFYAKNRLGMTDKVSTENNNEITEILITYDTDKNNNVRSIGNIL